MSDGVTDKENPVVRAWIEQAQGNPREVLLPEGHDPRVVEAAARGNELGVCRATVMGDPDAIRAGWAQQHPGVLMPDVPMIPAGPGHPLFDEMCEAYGELRAGDGGRAPNPRLAAKVLGSPVFLAAMLLRTGHTGAVIAGAVHTTADVLRAAKFVVGLQPGVNEPSSSFAMLGRRAEFGHEGNFIFADCGAVIDPDPATLASIAIASAETARRLLGCEPAVALLSYSTHGSAHHPRTQKIRDALAILRERAPELLVDGELQVDAAIIPEIADRKCPMSPLKGRANVLVFPDLNTGNIAYKLVERLAGAQAIGPLLQGLQHPVSDLSRGCTPADIVQSLTITSILAR